jgi:hypothetical protein
MDYISYHRKQMLIQRAEIAQRKAARMKDPDVKETMRALAVLYQNLARQVDELSFLRERARRLL